MAKGSIKEVFPGGNTSRGFFSYYDYVLDKSEAKRIFILKGGPGAGKSTFMRKIAVEMINRGFDIEYMHCSSDNDSLDGVVIPAIGVALVDGTAPHVIDPKYPGAVDEIINLGDFWDEEGMLKNKEEIIQCSSEISNHFSRAYRYLKAAAAIYEDIAAINSQASDEGEVSLFSWQIINELFGNTKPTVKQGKQRHLFASAITPNGFVNYLETVVNAERVFVLKGAPGTGTEKILEKVRAAAVERGFYTESYYCALMPTKLEHLVIPGVNAAFTTSNRFHNAVIQPYMIADLDEYLNKAMLMKHKDILGFNESEAALLMNRAVETIHKAKLLHDRLESYYIPNMDFEAIQRCREATLARILSYARAK